MKKNLLALCFLFVLVTNAQAKEYDASYREAETGKWKFGPTGLILVPVFIPIPESIFLERKLSGGLGFRTNVSGIPSDDYSSIEVVYIDPMLRWYPEAANQRVAISLGLMTCIKKHPETKTWHKKPSRKGHQGSHKCTHENCRSSSKPEIREWRWDRPSFKDIFIDFTYEVTNGFQAGISVAPVAQRISPIWSYNFAKFNKNQ